MRFDSTKDVYEWSSCVRDFYKVGTQYSFSHMSLCSNCRKCTNLLWHIIDKQTHSVTCLCVVTVVNALIYYGT